MGFVKLREWVGTVTGKGVRWGRDRIGRSAPAFLSTTALPPLTCTARGRPTSSGSCCFAARPANCWLLVLEACAGRRIRWLCPPAVACSAGCLFACHFACQAHCPSTSCPRSVCFAPFNCALFAPVHPCAPGSSFVSTNSLQAARLSRWQLPHGPAEATRAPVHLLTLLLLFPAESMILGHGVV